MNDEQQRRVAYDQVKKILDETWDDVDRIERILNMFMGPPNNLTSPLPPLNVPVIVCFFGTQTRFGPCDGPPSFLIEYKSIVSGDTLDRHRTCNKHGLDEIDRHHAANGTAPIHMTEVA